MNRPDLVPADPKYRKKVLRIFLICTAIGFTLLAALVPYLDKLVTGRNPEQSLRILSLVMIVLTLMPILVAVYIIRIALQTLEQRRFPPNGMKVFRDTPLLFEDDAKKRASILLLLSAIIISLSLIMALFGVRLISSFG